MKIIFPGKVNQGKGLAVQIIAKRFRLSFGIGKGNVRPVFYYKINGFDKILNRPTVLRHVNIFRFKNYVVGFSISDAGKRPKIKKKSGLKIELLDK